MTRLILPLASTFAFVLILPPMFALGDDAPADRVVAMYFHRTERCPTCKKMGSFAEEAVKTRFAGQIQDGTVAFYYVDFQDRKNAALTKGYRVTGPALIVAKIEKKKVANYIDLKDIWKKVADKPAFLKYVQDQVAVYLKPVPTR